MSRYQFLRPETGDLGWETWKVIWRRPLFWVVFLVAIALSVFLGVLAVKYPTDDSLILTLVLLPLAVIFFYISLEYKNVIAEFWKRLADINGWEYQKFGDIKEERGLIFKQGRNRRITNVIKGFIEDRTFRILSFGFDTGYGRNKNRHFYTIFAFKFNGTFPHIYLDSHNNYHSISAGEQIYLPNELKKKFALSAPRKYEVEALQIFTADVLNRLSQLRLKHDIEFLDQEMIIFAGKRLNDPALIEKELNDALEIEDLLESKLDKVKFEPIGDMPYTL